MKGTYWKPNKLFERTLKNAAETYLHEFIDPGNYVRGLLKSMQKVNITGDKFYGSNLGRWRVEIPGRHTYHGMNLNVRLAVSTAENGEEHYVASVYLTQDEIHGIEENEEGK